MSVVDAETVAAFLVESTRRARGRLWDEGVRRRELGTAPVGAPALDLIARRRLRGLPDGAVAALLGWAAGARGGERLDRVPTAREMLERQRRGRRCVSLVADEAARAHGDPRHPDGLSFAIHDLCHLEKLAAPEHHLGQVGFFDALARALDHPSLRDLEATLDAVWRSDRDYVAADMNGSAVFLFAILKMRLSMAVRRRLAAVEGRTPPTGGRLNDREREAAAAAIATLAEAMALPCELRHSAIAVSATRADPAAARALLAHFEQLGSRCLAEAAAPRA